MASRGSSIWNLRRMYLITMKMGPDMAPTMTAPQDAYRSQPAHKATVPEKTTINSWLG
jgi:hypothetical protein